MPRTASWYADSRMGTVTVTYTDPNPWDVIYFEGEPAPGRARIHGGGIGRKVDRKSGSGSDGLSLTDKGLDPKDVEIELLLWTDAMLREWDKLLPRILPTKLSKKDIVSVFYPSLNQIGFNRAYVEHIDALKPGPVIQTWITMIKLIDARIPIGGGSKTVIKASPLPAAAKPAAAGVSPQGAAAIVENLGNFNLEAVNSPALTTAAKP